MEIDNRFAQIGSKKEFLKGKKYPDYRFFITVKI